MGNNVLGTPIVKGLGFNSFGIGTNACSVDIDEENDKILRIRPLRFDEHYTPEDLNAWKLEARGKTFEPGFKTLISPLSLCYKKRVYSKNRIPYPMRRVDWDPNGERNPQNRGTSGYVRISWDEACATSSQARSSACMTSTGRRPSSASSTATARRSSSTRRTAARAACSTS